MDAAKTLKNHIKYLKNNSEKKNIERRWNFRTPWVYGFWLQEGYKGHYTRCWFDLTFRH